MPHHFRNDITFRHSGSSFDMFQHSLSPPIVNFLRSQAGRILMILEGMGNTHLLNTSFGPVSLLIVLSVQSRLILTTVQQVSKGHQKTDPILSHNIKEDWSIRNRQNKGTAYSYPTDIMPGFSFKFFKGHCILLYWFMAVVWSMENVHWFNNVKLGTRFP